MSGTYVCSSCTPSVIEKTSPISVLFDLYLPRITAEEVMLTRERVVKRSARKA